MKIHKNAKIEIGNRYGDFEVIEYTEKREPSNGCIHWKVRCIRCGREFVYNGNDLRFYKIMNCQACNTKRKYRKKR